MTTPRKITQRSLIQNGGFEEHYYEEGWEDHPEYPNQVLQKEDIQSKRRYLHFICGIIKQRFSLPVNPTKLDAEQGQGYLLSFEYQPTLTPSPDEEPYIELWARGVTNDKLEHSLIAPGIAASTAPQNDTDWLPYPPVFFTLYKDGDDAFEIRFASGKNKERGTCVPEAMDFVEPAAVNWPFGIGQLHLGGTAPGQDLPGVAVHLHLPALQLKEDGIRIALDGHLARWLPDGRVPICRGATHTLELTPRDENGWAGDGPYPGTHVYADWENAEEAERLSVTLRATKPEEDGEQPVTAPWTIECGNQASGLLSADIESIYDAPVFTLPCEVGHFKLVIQDHGQPERHWPIIPQNEKVELAVQVFNPKANGLADGVTVTWCTPDGQDHSADTGEDGWARYLYQPTADNTTVKASVDAPYNPEPDKYAFNNVRAIPTLPWGQFKITLDGDSVTPETPLSLNWGKAHELRIEPSDQCVLVGEKVELKWLNENASSGVTFSPPLEQPGAMPAEGLCWEVQCDENAAGVVELAFSCERMAPSLEFKVTVANFGISTLRIASRTEQEAGTDPFDLPYVRENALLYVRKIQPSV
ncbi:hypothetical protein [Mycoavidus sp. SF9855]|uniref:hypothetical protein n=1 Tax=Mycoavidus sp. SF9855 TaxID=2968475 RepID=UPI00211B8040|nr:hypothetical protein [Mycoavidus sp. SF9855]UUM22274.1 hypothetical protein NQD60_04210 [Mycoavidus sp. SF9855]